ncbi:MAG: 4-alpha-glucanotransferase, partial [Elusimicrobia bacterium]|nr:4-alpha-glucanotransferase [Elusimicrobiota bacterium]
AARHERDAFWRMASGKAEPAPPLRGDALKAVLAKMYGAGSALTLLQVQDVLGSRERINVPGTITPRNWTYRLPFTVEALRTAERPRRTAAMLRELALSTGRL